MSESEELLALIDGLKKDVRKQGRASIAAQSAAESCLEQVQALQEALQEQLAQSPPSQPQPAAQDELADSEAEDIVRALAPLIDALERTTDQARSFAEGIAKPSAIARFLGAADNTAVLESMAKGTRLLRAQLEDALANWNVTIDRRAGIPVDPARHRVVDTRAAAEGEEPDQVVEVVRPALLCKDRVLREADVVATR